MSQILAGRTKSCGCYHKDLIYRHGRGNTIEYQSWIRQRSRALRVGWEVEPDWGDYGKLLKDVGERPDTSHQLRRIDNSKGYVRGNLRWKKIEKRPAPRRSVKATGTGHYTKSTEYQDQLNYNRLVANMGAGRTQK